MIRKFVERQNNTESSDQIQLSTLFEMNGKGVSIFSDIENHKTIISDLPNKLDEQTGPLIRALQAEPGSKLEFGVGSRIEGYGVFSFSYGPVTYGIPEAGGSTLVTYGERILKVIPTINYKKRAVETSVVGMEPNDALAIIERTAGNFSASYSTCFATAVEQLMEIEVPRAVQWIRAVAIELERIYNHLQVFSRESEAASQNVSIYQTSALKERILRINSKYFGHRYLFGISQIGGMNADLLAKETRMELYRCVREVTEEFSELVDYFLSSRIFLDRLQNTAKLSKSDAVRLGAVGPAARGSSIDWDDRIAYPISPYDDVFVDVSTESSGDAMGRLMVRIKEIETSSTTIQQLLDKMPADSLHSTSIGKVKQSSDFSICRIESPSGDLIQAIKLSESGKIERLHIRPPSLANLLSFTKSLEGNVFTDFQFSFESFGLNFADCDR